MSVSMKEMLKLFKLSYSVVPLSITELSELKCLYMKNIKSKQKEAFLGERALFKMSDCHLGAAETLAGTLMGALLK